MKSYINEVSKDIREYYKILSNDFPEFLNDYIYTREMQKLAGINQICGSYWRKENIYGDNMYSVLVHSVGVALIIWNFTHDKKQVIAGLLHDISSPAFKHCIDFLNGDAEKQESTEEDTYKVIKNSKEIMDLLKRDDLTLEEVSDYKIYPIADNKAPKLSADRLEYTFQNGRYFKQIWDLDTIKKMYDDITIIENEDKEQELGFSLKEMAEIFVTGASKLWPQWISSEDTITMYFFAETLKNMYENKFINREELYEKSEQEIIELIRNCEDKNIANRFNKFYNCKDFYESETYIDNKFCVSRKVKKRYINPILKKGRIYDISNIAKDKIDNFNNMKISKFAYIDI